MSAREGSAETRAARCPVCDRGTLADIVYDVDPASVEPSQTSDSHEASVYTCGHRVSGPSLATADQERLDVERRGSEETVDPPSS